MVVSKHRERVRKNRERVHLREELADLRHKAAILRCLGEFPSNRVPLKELEEKLDAAFKSDIILQLWSMALEPQKFEDQTIEYKSALREELLERYNKRIVEIENTIHPLLHLVRVLRQRYFSREV